MQRIVVLNPKGGSGKTTLAINLAAYFAQRGDCTLLIDRDGAVRARWDGVAVPADDLTRRLDSLRQETRP